MCGILDSVWRPGAPCVRAWGFGPPGPGRAGPLLGATPESFCSRAGLLEGLLFVCLLDLRAAGQLQTIDPFPLVD